MYANILYACIYNMYVVPLNASQLIGVSWHFIIFPQLEILVIIAVIHSTIVEEDCVLFCKTGNS